MLCLRHSILVEARSAEDGPKNPLKGTSMKLLVAAFYAQFRVAAGRLGLRAVCNGIRNPTRFPWRLLFVVKMPNTLSQRDYVWKIKPITRCDFTDAVDRVACLE